MSGAVKAVGKGLSGVANFASPFASFLPGGSFLTQGAGLLGNALGGGGGMPAAPGAPAAGGGGILDWFKNPQNLALLGGGAAALFGANKMGAFNPQVVTDPRNQATSAFAQLLQSQLGQGTGGIGSRLAGLGTIPGYQGPFFAGATGGQQTDLQMVQDALARYTGGNQGQDILSQIMGTAQSGGGLNLPPEIAALLGGGGGQSILQGLGQGSDPVSQMLMALSGQQGAGYGQAQSLLGNQGNTGASMLASLFGGGSPEQAMLQQLAGGANNPFISQLARSGQGGIAGLQQLLNFGGQNNPALQALMGFDASTPERQLLLGAGGQDVTGGGQDIIRQASQYLMNLPNNADVNQLLAGGQGVDINQIASMLDTARQPGLNRDLANLREQFSFNGLRNSTDLESGASKLMSDSQAALTGQLASIMPQLAGQRSQTSLGALGALGNLGQTLGGLGQAVGNLGLGQQQNVLGAFGQAGQLGQGGNAQLLQAILGGGNLIQGGAGQNLQALLGAGNLQLGQKGVAQSGLQGAAGATTAQQQLINSILGQSGQLGLQSQGQNINIGQILGQLGTSETGQQRDLAGLLAQLGVTQQGQQQSALQSLLQSQLGAGTALQQGGTQQADILTRLFSGQQGNALQALLAAPGATSMFAQLPGQLGQQAFTMEDIIRQASQQGIQNQIGSFNQQQSLLPSLLAFLSGTPQQQVSDSMFSQLGGLAAAGAGLKASK